MSLSVLLSDCAIEKNGYKTGNPVDGSTATSRSVLSLLLMSYQPKSNMATQPTSDPLAYARPLFLMMVSTTTIAPLWICPHTNLPHISSHHIIQPRNDK
jgi:hypothetical protein